MTTKRAKSLIYFYTARVKPEKFSARSIVQHRPQMFVPEFTNADISGVSRALADLAREGQIVRLAEREEDGGRVYRVRTLDECRHGIITHAH